MVCEVEEAGEGEVSGRVSVDRVAPLRGGLGRGLGEEGGDVRVQAPDLAPPGYNTQTTIWVKLPSLHRAKQKKNFTFWESLTQYCNNFRNGSMKTMTLFLTKFWVESESGISFDLGHISGPWGAGGPRLVLQIKLVLQAY